MGLLRTSWAGTYRGHSISVSRSELTRGFAIDWDGRRLGKKWWSLFGLGELAAEVELDGRRVRVVAKLSPISRCELTVDGNPVETTRVR